MPAAARFVDGLTKQHDAKEAEMKDALKRLKERGSEVVESSMFFYYVLFCCPLSLHGISMCIIYSHIM